MGSEWVTEASYEIQSEAKKKKLGKGAMFLNRFYCHGTMIPAPFVRLLPGELMERLDNGLGQP